MHRSLQNRNLSGLPFTFRKLANEAVQGSVSSLAALCVAAGNMRDEYKIPLLPVFYAVLDVDDLPDPEGIDASTFPFTSLNRIFMAVDALSKINGIERGALEELWPRVWACIQLLQAARQYKSPDGSLELDVTRIVSFRALDMFENKEGSGAMYTNPAVWNVVGQGWKAILRSSDPLCDNTFLKCCRFVTRATYTPEKLGELTDGVGGSAALALLVVQHINFGLQHLQDDTTYLYGGIGFLDRTQGMDPSLHAALLIHDIVPLCTTVVAKVGSSGTDLQGFRRPQMLNYSLCVLFGIITRSTGSIYAWLLQSFKAGLIDALLDVSRHFPDQCVTEPMESFLTDIITAAMVDLACATQAIASLPTIFGSLRNSITGPLLPLWEKFLQLVTQRFGVIQRYDTAESMRACDNDSCCEIGLKSVLRRCSNCQTTYYCSTACQLTDWRLGGHREYCLKLKSSLTADYADVFGSRQLSFMRLLLHDDYLAHHCQVLCRQVAYMKHYGGMRDDFYTLFWYTMGEVIIEVRAIGDCPASGDDDWAVDWAYWARRRAQSGGRMDLHVMVISQLGGTEARMFPKRSCDSRVSEGLKAMAQRPLKPREEELEDIEKGVLELIHQEERCIH
ncbi:hypothetical protein DFH06DRAFT_1472583 [Mycena polygramma]|nr:hypothetical protein DFH06DRAFT_1472583 [Mycena polygramma]